MPLVVYRVLGVEARGIYIPMKAIERHTDRYMVEIVGVGSWNTCVCVRSFIKLQLLGGDAAHKRGLVIAC